MTPRGEFESRATPRPSRRAPGAALASAALALLVAGAAPAATVQFAATIDGAQETPPNASLAMGSGSFVMDTDANTLAYTIVISVPPPTGEIGAHIHGFAGPGVPAGIVHPLPLGSPKIGVWNYLEAQEADIIAGLTYVNIHSAAFPGGEIRGQILRAASCGDGFLDGGEDCDDGNTDAGDCCSASCAFEAAASPCSGASLCAATGVCDGAGACVAAPRGTCRAAAKSILLFKDNADDGKDKLLWKWLKGDATTQGDFGLPSGTTNYALCVYAGTTETLIADADIAADAVKWSPISTKGYKYKDSSGTSDGIQKVVLKGGAQGKAKALVKGKGSGLPDPTLGDMPLPVLAELVNSANGICFAATYDANDVIKDDDAQFKAKAQ